MTFPILFCSAFYLVYFRYSMQIRLNGKKWKSEIDSSFSWWSCCMLCSIIASVHPTVRQSICSSVRWSVLQSICLSVCLFVHLSVHHTFKFMESYIKRRCWTVTHCHAGYVFTVATTTTTTATTTTTTTKKMTTKMKLSIFLWGIPGQMGSGPYRRSQNYRRANDSTYGLKMIQTASRCYRRADYVTD